MAASGSPMRFSPLSCCSCPYLEQCLCSHQNRLGCWRCRHDSIDDLVGSLLAHLDARFGEANQGPHGLPRVLGENLSQDSLQRTGRWRVLVQEHRHTQLGTLANDGRHGICTPRMLMTSPSRWQMRDTS